MGREAGARLVERDDYVVWVLSEHLIDYTNNWIERKHDGGLLRMLTDLGVPYKVTRIGNGAVVAISFPWGSSLSVFPGANLAQLGNAVGGSADLIIVDEAQKIGMLRKWLSKTAIPATKDRRGEIVLTGTPGEEEGSLFHRASTGGDKGWEVHRFFAWDNPHFGDTFEERFRRSTVDPIEADRETLRVTEEQVSAIRELTQEQAENILEHLPDLYEDRLTEDFGVWPRNPSLLVLPTAGISQERLYWGRNWAETETWQCITQEPDAALEQPQQWRELMRDLPQREYHGHKWAKRWVGLVGCDLGFDPDPFSLWAGVYSAEDSSMYELDAYKVLRMDADAQFAALRNWVEELHQLCEGRIGAVVIDASGPVTSMGSEWRKRLMPYLPEKDIVIAPYKAGKYAQYKAMNADTAAGKVKLRRNSPTDVERRYLWWEPYDEKKPGRIRDVDSPRKVHIADGSEQTPGDHAIDAMRYAWYHSYRGKTPDVPDVLTPEQIEIRQHEAWERGQVEQVGVAKVHTWRKGRR